MKMIVVAFFIGLFGKISIAENGVWPVRAEAVRAGFSRNGFVHYGHQIKSGMSKQEVRALLGEPDDVVNDSTTMAFPMEIWGYGTNGKRTFPTLGRVKFTNDGTTMVDSEFPVPPPPPGMFDEGNLRSLMRQIDWSFFTGAHTNYGDPLATIRGTMALYPLGKERALAVLREVDGRLDMFAPRFALHDILLALFGGSRTQTLEGSVKILPADASRTLFFVRGIPLVVDTQAQGLPYEANAIAFVEENGTLPPRIAIPTTDLGIVIDEYARRFGQNNKGRVLSQLALLVRTISPVDPELFDPARGNTYSKSKLDALETFLRGLKRKGLLWNSKDACYELKGQKPLDPLGYTTY